MTDDRGFNVRNVHTDAASYLPLSDKATCQDYEGGVRGGGGGGELFESFDYSFSNI